MKKSIIPDEIHPLPYYRERTEKIKYIVIHCSRSTPENQIKTLNEYKLSAHYIIGRNGKLTAVIPEDKVAYHAGMSKWKNSKGESLNGTSIGIELESPAMGQKPKSYTVKQVDKLINLLKTLTKKYKIKAENIVGHSDIAPTRKPDPGAYFPWKKLYQKGLINWYRGSKKKINKEDEKKTLAQIGYNTEVLEAARYAFCRRWLREEVMIEKDIPKLVDNPYPKDFKVKDEERYLRRLYAVRDMKK